LEIQRDQIVIKSEEAIADYDEMKHQLEKYRADVQAVITDPNYILPFLQPGRLVKVKDQDIDWGWGVIINFQAKWIKVRSTLGKGENDTFFFLLLHVLFASMIYRIQIEKKKFDPPMLLMYYYVAHLLWHLRMVRILQRKENQAK
jgi:superfamily II RNA helicase